MFVCLFVLPDELYTNQLQHLPASPDKYCVKSPPATKKAMTCLSCFGSSFGNVLGCKNRESVKGPILCSWSKFGVTELFMYFTHS